MIKTETLKKISDGRSTAYFSNGEIIEFSIEELCAFHIREGREYSLEEYEALIHNVMCQRAKSVVMPYVVYTKRTEKQVYDKIKDSGFTDEVAVSLVSELKEKEYISDKDYCRSFIKKTLEKGESKQKILWELKNKGVSVNVAEEVYKEFSPDELNQAIKSLNKKLRTGGKKDYNKLYGFLQRKGFSAGIARKALQEIDVKRNVGNEEY